MLIVNFFVFLSFVKTSVEYFSSWELTPVCEKLMPRLITVNLIFLSIPAAEEMAARIQAAIKKVER